MNIEYTMLMQGSKTYYDGAIGPLFEHYQQTFDDMGWVQSSEKIKNSNTLFIDERVSNNATGFLANFVLGTVIFVAGWSATKILDHFVKDKLIDKTIDLAIYLQGKFNLDQNKCIEIRHIVWYEDIDLAVVIRLIVNGKEERETTSNLLNQAHKDSIDWFIKNGKSSPVHSYLIQKVLVI